MINRLIDNLSLQGKASFYRNFSVIICIFLFITTTKTSFAQGDSILVQKINIPDQRTSIYEILNQITDITGYFFIYDSKILNSDKKISIYSDGKTLKEILSEILSNPSLDFKVIEKHILIFVQRVNKEPVPISVKADTIKYITLKGQVLDKQTSNPLSYVTVGIIENNIGTVSNFDGFFSLKIPSSFVNSTIIVSHLGYKSQKIPAELLLSQKVDIFLETDYISLQEVIIHNIDPLSVVKKAYKNRSNNYSQEPIYITSFYREGVIKDDKYINYSEAVLKIFKSSYSKSPESDQIKLLKSRKIINVDQTDTLILKIRSGIKSCLTLDLAKSIPDFFDPEYIDSYNYSRVDIVSIDSRNAYAIAFEQKETEKEALFKGILYIDMNNFALVRAEFEVNPKHIRNADDLFIVKRSRKFTARPEKIGYTVNYNLWNGKYYINHIRGDLNIKFKKRYRFFYNDFHAFLEIASCQIDTLNVVKFSKDEVLKTNSVFLDTKYVYDESFWGTYNTIVPEEKLSEALSRINSKIEEIHP
ncbi:MAG: carboxypeptidase-like regulatory domain-containing protein [Tenuifilaceae bacterium]